MKVTQATRNRAYGLQIRLAGLIRRGEDQEKIDAVREQYEEIMEKIEREDK